MALPTASDNAFPSILITEGTEPSAPAAGKQRLYIDSTTHKLKRTDSSGTDVTIETAGTTVATDTIFDAKGDLAVGTGADTAAKLTVGANGTHPVADSAQSTGLKYQGVSVTRVRRTTTQNVSGSGTLTSISWDTEDEDTDGAWAIGTPTQIVIPAALNGRRAIVAGSMTWESAFSAGTYRGLYLKMNAAIIVAVVVSTSGQTTLADQQFVATPYPITLTTGDTFELQMRINTTGHGCAATTQFCLYTVD